MSENEKKSIETIIKKLNHQSADIRQEALKEAMFCADTIVLENVKKLLNDSNPAVRYYAKKAFASISAQIATRAMLNAEEEKIKETLKTYDDEKDNAISDFIPVKSKEIIKKILSIPDEKNEIQAEQLINELNNTDDKYVIATIIKKLGKIGTKKHEKYIIPYLSHEDPRIIANAIEALDELKSEIGIHEMLKLLSHEDNRVKGNITKILYKYLEKDNVSKSLILDKLKNMLNSNEPWTQDSAIFALQSIGNQQALEILESFNAKCDIEIQNKIKNAILELKRKLNPEFDKIKQQNQNLALKTIQSIDDSLNKSNVLENTKSKLIQNTFEFLNKFKSFIWHDEENIIRNLLRTMSFIIGGIFILFLISVLMYLTYFLTFGRNDLVNKNNITQQHKNQQIVLNETQLLDKVYELIEVNKLDSALKLVNELKQNKNLNEKLLEAINIIFSKKVLTNISKNEYNKALEQIELWQNEYPNSTMACILKGQIELKHLNLEKKARLSFSNALIYDSNCIEAYLGLGDCDYFSGNYENALLNYNQALKLCSYSSSDLRCYALFGVANIKAIFNDYPNAILMYKEAISLNPNYLILYIGLANLYKKIKKYDDALAVINKALEIDSNNLMLNLEKAEILKNLGKLNEALTFYKIAYNNNPEDIAILLPYINILFELQIYQGLDQLINKAISKVNKLDAKPLYEKLGIIEYSQYYLESAKNTFETINKLYGDSDLAYYYLALIAEENNNYDEAINFYKKAILTNKKHLPSYLNLSNIYLNIKKDYKALDDIIEEGIINLGNQPSLLYNKALGKYFDNKPYEALVLLRAIINSNDPFVANLAKTLEQDIRQKYKNQPLPNQNKK